MRNPKGCWIICVAAALAMFCTLGLNINAFSVYIPYLTKHLQLNPAQNSGFLVVRNLFSVAGVYLAKYYYDKLNIKLGFSLILILNAIGVFLYASACSFTELCIAAAVSGLCYGLGGMYPVAILIHRWFPIHEGVAMGICSAATGLALTIFSPILTALTENYSMQFAMYFEIAFLVLCLFICVCLIRNYPNEGLHYEKKAHTKKQPVKIGWMFFAIIALGTMGGGFSYLTVHYSTEGFNPYQVSALISVFGITLTIAKFLLGVLLDVWGSYRTNWVFFTLAILSCAIFCLGSKAGYPIALFAACIFGIGDALPTVGVSVYAKDLSSPENFPSVQQQYQTATMLGGLLCMPIPGIIATATGNYRAFYLLITSLTVFAAIVIQTTYAKRRRK